ncbi:hypothetical protein TNCV_1654331 [Trichonephila clavipes]|nr:hypothetical protein TNCV_1654331 [Trichonephila clavipes]
MTESGHDSLNDKVGPWQFGRQSESGAVWTTEWGRDSLDDREEDAESLSNDCGIMMPPVPKCDKYTFFRDGKRKIGNYF